MSDDSKQLSLEERVKERVRLLFETDPKDLPIEIVLDEIIQRYKPAEIPVCRVCGGPLSIESAGGGMPTVWICSPYEDDPDNPNKIRLKEGRSLVDEHCKQSRYEQRRHGDSLVMELVRRYCAVTQHAPKAI